MILFALVTALFKSSFVLCTCRDPRHFRRVDKLIALGEQLPVDIFFNATTCEIEPNIDSLRQCYNACEDQETCVGLRYAHGECWICDTSSRNGQIVPESIRPGFYIVVQTSADLGCKSTLLGREYMGMIAISVHGDICQRWDSQSPHRHTRVDIERFPETGSLADAGNYCRNPDNEPNGPWCYTINPSDRWAYCNVPFCAGLETAHCRETSQGREYHGAISVTSSGLTCQRWDQQSPHAHDQTNIVNFPEIDDLSNVHNYCRNPSRDSGPWCYTSDVNTTWEYCDVPNC